MVETGNGMWKGWPVGSTKLPPSTSLLFWVLTENCCVRRGKAGFWFPHLSQLGVGPPHLKVSITPNFARTKTNKALSWRMPNLWWCGHSLMHPPLCLKGQGNFSISYLPPPSPPATPAFMNSQRTWVRSVLSQFLQTTVLNCKGDVTPTEFLWEVLEHRHPQFTTLIISFCRSTISDQKSLGSDTFEIKTFRF